MDDRTEAIDILTKMSTNHFYGHREQKAFKLGAEALTQRWIPVTERLPEEDGRYLITGKRGTVYSLEYEDKRWDGGIEPIAWMPLPTPYKGGGQNG